MDGFEKDYHYSDVTEVSTMPSQPQEVQQDMPESITRRLRDRTLLKRKREEAQEKDSYQGQTSSKGKPKGKTTGRGRRKVKKPEPEPDVHSELAPEVEPQPEPEILQEKTENGQEHLLYPEDPDLAVTKEEDKEPEPEEEASPVSLATIPLPEALSFSQEHQREEQNIYTYLL